MRATQLRKIEE